MFQSSWVHHQEEVCIRIFRLVFFMHLHKNMKNIPYKNYLYWPSSWWWTHDFRYI